MGKFWERRTFRTLHVQWRKKLAASGFSDIENDREHLTKNLDTRTAAYQSLSLTQQFYTDLGHYLAHHEIDPDHRRILELYAQGVHIQGTGGIMEQTGFSDSWCRKIIRKYSQLVILNR